jgi:hypothetical protein
LLTHRSSTAISQTYVHLDPVGIRDAFVQSRVWHEEGQ